MTDDINAAIDAELQADLARKRAEIARQQRVADDLAHLAKINARHPIQGPGDPRAEAERRRAMDERAAADFERMARVNGRRDIDAREMAAPGRKFEPKLSTGLFPRGRR